MDYNISTAYLDSDSSSFFPLFLLFCSSTFLHISCSTFDSFLSIEVNEG